MRLIDADALKAYIDAQKGRPFIGCTIGEALKIMTDEQPTIEPERKKGRWIKVGHIENTYLVSKCYVCGYQTIDAGNYCTNCGAQMEEAT